MSYEHDADATVYAESAYQAVERAEGMCWHMFAGMAREIYTYMF